MGKWRILLTSFYEAKIIMKALEAKFSHEHKCKILSISKFNLIIHKT